MRALTCAVPGIPSSQSCLLAATGKPPQACAAFKLHLTCLTCPELRAAGGTPADSGALPAAEASLCCRDASRPPIADLTALPPAFGSLILGGPGGGAALPSKLHLKAGLARLYGERC